MPASIIGNPAVVTGLYQAFNGKAAGYNTYTNNLAFAAQNGPAAYAAEIGKGFYAVPAATLADTVLKNVGIDNAVLEDALVQIFTAYPVQARGQIVLNLINLLGNLEADATYGAAATAWNKLVASNNAYSNNPTNLADQVIDTSVQTLTSGADVLAGNIFNAARSYTPGGTDQVNTLNDDDVLTGTGTNPTLNFTFVDDVDVFPGANTIITPTLNNIQTVNVSVQGANNKILDLQDTTGVDAVNVSRVNNTNFTAQNIASAASKLSINNSQAPGNNISFSFLGAALAGTTDATTLTLNNANVNTVLVEQNGLANNGNPLTAQGFETINLVSSGSTNNVNIFRAEDLRTLNISGSQNLRIGAFQNVGGSLTLIDGSTATGNLDITLSEIDAANNLVGNLLNATADGTSGTNVAVTVRTGTGADTVRIINDTIGATDRIDTGTGTDTLDLRANQTNNFTPAVTGASLVDGVENLNVTRTAAATAGQVANALIVDMARIGGDQVTTLSNLGDAGLSAAVATLTTAAGAEGAATFVLANANAGDAAGVRITHSSTSNNGLGSNAIVLDVDAGVTTAGVEIREGTNNDPRFNFSLNADSNLTFNPATGAIVSGAADATNAVVNVTLTDSDSESNSVALVQAARHTGTITLAGGTAGTFLNLDATTGGGAAAGGYGHVLTGAAGDATTAAAGTPEARDTAVARVFTQGLAGDQILAATSIAASGFAGNAELRLGTSNTNAQLGSGDDTVIFADRAGITAATAGLTISDTVSGGAGLDTIVLDGTGVQTLGASEWTNLSGIDVLRLAGAAGTFNIRVTDQLVGQADAGNRITIINNDGDLRTQNELTANIDLRAMSATKFVTFIGNNSDGQNGVGTVQTVIVNDVTANGSNVLNGGDVNVVSEYVVNGRNAIDASAFGTATFATQANADAEYALNVAAGLTGNNNVLRIFNTAEVTVGDLANTSNFSTITFENDQASVQTLNLTLNDAVVDALVDASHTATATQRETLTIRAVDNPILAAATANLNVNAAAVGGQFSLNVTGGAGADVIVGGAGADVITGGAGADTITTGLGADQVNYVQAGLTFAQEVANTGNVATGAIDVITDFTAGTDTINFTVAGAAQTIASVAVANANYAAALAQADAAFTADATVGGLSYFVAAYGAGAAWTAVLFIDSDAAAGGTADGAIQIGVVGQYATEAAALAAITAAGIV